MLRLFATPNTKPTFPANDKLLIHQSALIWPLLSRLESLPLGLTSSSCYQIYLVTLPDLHLGWILFGPLVLALLATDLILFHRDPRPVDLRRSLQATAGWVASP